MLFDTYRTAGGLTLANRIAMAPMTRCRANHADAIPNALIAEYYRQRNDIGLIISEGVPVSDRARGYLNTPALWNEAQAEGWKQVTAAVHEGGGKIFAQIWHCGRISHRALHADGSAPAGASAQPAQAEAMIAGPDGLPTRAACDTPEALSTAAVKGIVEEFRNAARLARIAGFDGVEIHGANGYLLDQFRCPVVNDRTDEYGGSLENRYRLLLEVVDAAIGEVGAANVCVRQSPYGAANGISPDPEPMVTYPWFAAELAKRGVGFLHIYCQTADWIHDAAHPMMPALRAAFKGTLIACGGFHNAEKSKAILQRGHADMVAIGKPLIANPDLLERFRRGAALNRWDMKTFYAPGPAGYTDYPRL